MSSLTVTSPLLNRVEGINDHQQVFEVKRWLLGKRDKTVFSNGDITYTKSYSACCCRPFTTKVIRGNRLESAELESAGITERNLFWIWLFLGLCGAHRVAAGRWISGLALLSSFLAAVAATATAWVVNALAATVVRWLADFFMLRSWTRTTIKLITNNANETEVVIDEHDNEAFDDAVRDAMAIPDEGVV